MNVIKSFCFDLTWRPLFMAPLRFIPLIVFLSKRPRYRQVRNSSFRVRHAVLFPLYCAAIQLKKKTMIVIFFIRKRIWVFRVNKKSSFLGRDPFNQNFRKFWSKTQWIGSVQPEKFRKNWSTFWGGPLFPVGPVWILVEWIAPLSYPKVGHFLDFRSLCFRLSGGFNVGNWE